LIGRRTHWIGRKGWPFSGLAALLVGGTMGFVWPKISQAMLEAQTREDNETWAGKAQQTALEFESILELVAKKTRAHPEFLCQLNPSAIFLSPAPGTTIIVPDTEYNGEDLAREIKRVLTDFRPTILATTHPRDQHPDHCATYFFVRQALRELHARLGDLVPDRITPKKS